MAQEDEKPTTDDAPIPVEELDTVSGGLAREGVHTEGRREEAHSFSDHSEVRER
jgi:hypothetical protein